MNKTPEQINNRMAGQDNLGSAGFQQTPVAILVTSGVLLNLCLLCVTAARFRSPKIKFCITKKTIISSDVSLCLGSLRNAWIQNEWTCDSFGAPCWCTNNWTQEYWTEEQEKKELYNVHFASIFLKDGKAGALKKSKNPNPWFFKNPPIIPTHPRARWRRRMTWDRQSLPPK